MTNLNTGLAAQLGIAEEATHGVASVVARFFEFTSESLSMTQARVESQGLAAGRFLTRRWAPGARTVGGALNLELADRGFGVLFKHALGAVATSVPDGATVAKLHTFTPGLLPAGLTVQVGRPDVDAVVQPFTYTGCMVSEWTVSATVGDLVSTTFTMDGQDEKTDVALAVATYPEDLGLMVFTGAALSIAGDELEVNSFSLSGNNNLGTDRHRLGRVTRKQPTQGRREFTGEFEAEFAGLDLYNRFVVGEEATLVLNCEGPEVEDGIPSRLTITANVRFDGQTPQVGGPEEVPQTMQFKVIDNGTLSIEVEYVTADATP